MSTTTTLDNAPLGQKSTYDACYNPDFLFPIPRISNRNDIDVPTPLPFKGFDIWNAFEISWLNNKGKPLIAIAECQIPCESPNIVESKSFKLYLNSFNNTQFASWDEVENTIKQDLSDKIGMDINLKLKHLKELEKTIITEFTGTNIDDLDIHCDTYQVNPEFLCVESAEIVEETLVSNLLKSNCLVTGQPDWGSLQIHYKGPQIIREGLLKYIISFRNHNEFAEQCAERIFTDIFKYCHPTSLTIHIRYTRRGGLDINAIRSTNPIKDDVNLRLPRQ